MADKQCTKCGLVKATSEFWMKRPEKGQLYAQCKSCVGAKNKAWLKRNPQRNAEYLKGWKERAGMEHVRAVWAEMRRRRMKDPRHKIAARVSTSIYISLLGQRKHKPTFQLLGYSRDELMQHLERQFLRGMTWDNYGEWHIDHIVPLSSFNITDSRSPDLVAAWALTNLRPLWARDNILKKDHRMHLI